jgi:hypothetical protein
MAVSFLKLLLPPPLRQPLKNLNLIPYQVPTFTTPPIHVPNQQDFFRSFNYLGRSLARPRRPRMPAFKTVLGRRQRTTKYCTCPDCQSKRLFSRVSLPFYFRSRRVSNSWYRNPASNPQMCKRKIHTEAREDENRGRFWTRVRRALRATKIEWYPIPIGLGVAYIAFAHLRKMRERRWSSERPVREDVKIHGPWQVYVLSTLPLRSISRIWGHLNAIELPVFMRAPGYKLYSWIFGCRLDEMKEPDLTKYRNLAEFFSRELRDGVRVIDHSAELVSHLHEMINCRFPRLMVKYFILVRSKDVELNKLKAFHIPSIPFLV